MVVQATPGPALEVVQPQLVLHLLVRLLAHPPRFDQRGQGFERGIGREIGQVVLALAGGAVLADQPTPLACPLRSGSSLRYGFGPEEDARMPRKRHTAEGVVAKLRQVDVLTA